MEILFNLRFLQITSTPLTHFFVVKANIHFFATADAATALLCD